MTGDYFLAVADNEFWPHQQELLRGLDRRIEDIRQAIAEAGEPDDLGRHVRLRSAISHAAYIRRCFREMVLKDFQITFGRTIP